MAETADKSAEMANISTRRRISLAVSATPAFPSHIEGCYIQEIVNVENTMIQRVTSLSARKLLS